MKPATPLPWKQGVRHPCRIICGSPDHHVVVASTAYPEDEGAETEVEKLDAAYIVHAANSYSTFVETLRKIKASQSLAEAKEMAEEALKGASE